MNELLQRHGCSNVFFVPEGLKELMSDISREVLREQPKNIYEFIANYLSALLITRDHGLLAVKILEDLCGCKATVAESLVEMGLAQDQADDIATLVEKELEGYDVADGKPTKVGDDSETVSAIEETLALETVLTKEKFREADIIKKILQKHMLDEVMTAKVCQVVRNAYRDYWYRKMVSKKVMEEPTEPWEVAAQHTLELYKRTKPTLEELTRATTKIQAAYRAYHVRKNLLSHLKPKKPVLPPEVKFETSPEIDLGPVVTIRTEEDDVEAIFDAQRADKHRTQYDPMKKVMHYNSESPRSPEARNKDIQPTPSEGEQALLTDKSQTEVEPVVTDQQEEFVAKIEERQLEEEIPEIAEDIPAGDETSSEIAPTVSSYPDTDAGEFDTSAEDNVTEAEEVDVYDGDA